MVWADIGDSYKGGGATTLCRSKIVLIFCAALQNNKFIDP